MSSDEDMSSDDDMGSEDDDMTASEDQIAEVLEDHYPDADVGLFMDGHIIADMDGYSVIVSDSMVLWEMEFNDGSVEVSLGVWPEGSMPALREALDRLDAIVAKIEPILSD